MNDWMDGGTANGVVLISHPFPPQNRGIIRFRTCDRTGTDALKKTDRLGDGGDRGRREQRRRPEALVGGVMGRR